MEQLASGTAQNLILFDGVCNLCNSSVQYIIRHDARKKFQFASLQSPVGQALIARHHLDPAALFSVIYIRDEQLFMRSDAALEIIREFGGVWKIVYAFRIIPRAIRDFLYDLVAKNRYRLFGKRDQCMIPTPELRSRFLA